MQLVVLAGGRGTRMGPLGDAIPKALLPVDGKPLLEHQLELARRYGVRDVLVLTGYRGEMIEEQCGDGSRWGLRIRYLREATPLGTAGALKQAEKLLEPNFLVFYGDLVLDMDLPRLLAYHAARQPIATLVVHPNNHPHDSDLLDVTACGRIRTFYPKPHDPRQCYPNLVNAAVYVLSRRIVDFLPAHQHRDIARDVFPSLLKAGEELVGYRTAEYIADAGTPERLALIARDVASGRVAASNRGQKRPAVFLDRDGVLNEEVDHVRRPEQFTLLPGAGEAIAKLNRAGVLSVIVSNQPGIAKGFFDESTLSAVHRKMESLFGEHGAYVDAIYYCPHHPARGFPGERPEYKIPCECRKPSPGMLFDAAAQLNIDLGRSFVVGDRTTDIEAGRRAGCRTVLVRTGYGGRDALFPCRPTFVFNDVRQAVSHLIEA